MNDFATSLTENLGIEMSPAFEVINEMFSSLPHEQSSAEHALECMTNDADSISGQRTRQIADGFAAAFNHLEYAGFVYTDVEGDTNKIVSEAMQVDPLQALHNTIRSPQNNAYIEEITAQTPDASKNQSGQESVDTSSEDKRLIEARNSISRNFKEHNPNQLQDEIERQQVKVGQNSEFEAADERFALFA